MCAMCLAIFAAVCVLVWTPFGPSSHLHAQTLGQTDSLPGESSSEAGIALSTQGFTVRLSGWTEAPAGWLDHHRNRPDFRGAAALGLVGEDESVVASAVAVVLDVPWANAKKIRSEAGMRTHLDGSIDVMMSVPSVSIEETDVLEGNIGLIVSRRYNETLARDLHLGLGPAEEIRQMAFSIPRENSIVQLIVYLPAEDEPIARSLRSTLPDAFEVEAIVNASPRASARSQPRLWLWTLAGAIGLLVLIRFYLRFRRKHARAVLEPKLPVRPNALPGETPRALWEESVEDDETESAPPAHPDEAIEPETLA